MAGLTREQRAAREAERAKQVEAISMPLDDGLVEMRKDGETLRVHPSCVRAHHLAGWKVQSHEVIHGDH